jgi:hypothetical protein
MKYICISVLCTILFSSCYTTGFEYYYNTRLENHSPQNDLNYSDSLFNFQFLPVPNGIYFTITNNTNESVSIDWDNSYFTEPSGNTYKALNSDFIGLSNELALKQTNTTIIPPKGKVSRFTTSNKNLSSFSIYTNTNMFYDALNGVSNYSSLSRYDKFVTAGNYWPIYQSYSGESTVSQMDSTICTSFVFGFNIVKDYMKNNNNLGLGLKLNHKNTSKNYDFKFKFVNSMIYYKYVANNIPTYYYKCTLRSE